jgi:hypothetical protein
LRHLNECGLLISTDHKAALGDYYYEPSSELFTTSVQSAAAANPELAGSRGKLAMVASEPADVGGASFKVNKLKNWRGNDVIQARNLYSAPISFRPKFAMILVMNDKPPLDKADAALAKTLRIIDFPFEFVEVPSAPHQKRLDAGLKARFEGDVRYRQQLIRLLVASRQEDAVMYSARAHIPYPESVGAATSEYLEDNNTLGTTVAEWLAEHYDVGPDVAASARLRASDLLTSFVADNGWQIGNSACGEERRVNAVTFKRAMDAMSPLVRRERFNNCIHYSHIVRRRP